MKKITLKLLFLLTFSNAFSQDLIEGYKINPKTKKIEFSEIINSSKSNKELTHLAFNWALGHKSEVNYKKIQHAVINGEDNSETVHWSDKDGTLNILKTKNFVARGGGNIIYQVNYTTKIQVRNNIYKYTLTNFRYKHHKKSANNKDCFNNFHALETIEKGCGGGNVSYKTLQERSLIQIKDYIKELKSFMNLDIDTWD